MNKEEIKEYTLANLREHCIKTMQFSNKNSNTYKEHELVLKTIDDNISLKEYIEQLERIIKTMSKEQTHKQDEYCSHYCNIFIEHEQLENKVKEQEAEIERIKLNLKSNTIEKMEDFKAIAKYIEQLEQENEQRRNKLWKK